MAVCRRQTSKGKTKEYHYAFMVDGKRYRGVCKGCTTLRAAEAYEAQLRETTYEAAKSKTVKELVETFRNELTGGTHVALAAAFDLYLKKPTKRVAGTLQTARNRSYWNDFTGFMAACYPEVKKLADVQRRHAEEYIMLLRTSGAFDKTVTYTQGNRVLHYQPKNDQLSSRTVNARHKAVKAVFSRLAEDAGLVANPFEIPTLENNTASRNAFTLEELKLIGEKMTMPYIRPLFTIGLCTGLTVGDICLLKWSEISGSWITNKQRRKTKVALEIPILPPLAAFLNEQRAYTGSGEYVCPELAAMYQTNSSGVFYRVKEFLESLGIRTTLKIEGRSRSVSNNAAHAMRHTFAYLAGVYNIPQTIVQSVLGHMTPEMTALYQQHAQREEKERFFRQMPNVLGIAVHSDNAGNVTSAEVPLLPMVSPAREALKQLIDTLPDEKVRALLDRLESGRLF